ncbi:MAG: threonine ammonia-lyase [Desulfurococcales archaeon]|nr:threonine ammonia-lyase [Desulfurococcales archaeon]
MTPEYIASLTREAVGVLGGVVHRTPLDFSATFSRMTGARVYLKLENLQKTGAFKVRGAYFKISRLSPEERARGVVAASAGNHAQGVAFAASRQGVKATIVMPETAPQAKVDATRGYGAEVVLYGRVYDDAYSKALEIARETGATFIHPFDDPLIIAGQGTIAVEIEEQLGGPPDLVVVPVGGGGLASGIASWLKTRHPGVRVVGVEPAYAPKFTRSLEAGRPVEVPASPGLMDGLVTKKPGRITFSLLSRLLDGMVTVTDEEVARAIFLLLERSKTLAEGAGAAALAALLSGKVEVREGERVAVIVSGGNIDMTRLPKVVYYQLVREYRVVRLQGLIPDAPGWLNRVLEVLARAKLNIIDIRHDRMLPFLEPGWAEVEVIAEAPSPQAVSEVLEALNSLGLPFRSSELPPH